MTNLAMPSPFAVLVCFLIAGLAAGCSQPCVYTDALVAQWIQPGIYTTTGDVDFSEYREDIGVRVTVYVGPGDQVEAIVGSANDTMEEPEFRSHVARAFAAHGIPLDESLIHPYYQRCIV